MEEKEKKAQELYMEFQAVDQHVKQLERQLEIITKQLFELNVTHNSLEDFAGIKAGKEVFIPLSSGIFAKASISDTSELLVNVGANAVVRKDVPSTKKLIQDQIEELKKIHKKTVEDLERMANHAAQLEMQLQKMVPQG